MILPPELDRRPLVVCIAGPNGAGKTTFYEAYLRATALPFFNADHLAREFQIDAYAAAELAEALRRKCIAQRESFIFETVFSDPVGDKLDFLAGAAESGYTVVLCFIGLSRTTVSEQRVAMRVAQGGHDVPSDKLRARFPRTLANLRTAIRRLPHVLVYDNDNLDEPFRLLAVYEAGCLVETQKPWPKWFRKVIVP